MKMKDKVNETDTSIKINSDGSITVSADQIQVNQEPDKCDHQF